MMEQDRKTTVAACSRLTCPGCEVQGKLLMATLLTGIRYVNSMGPAALE